MKPAIHLLAVAATLLLGADVLAASVTCQSRNNQREDCTLRGRGEVVLTRQISKTTCVKGRNWDETRQGLYVTDGCGGVFETRDGWNDRPGQGGGWSGGPPPAGNGYGDLVGVRAASGESELQRRGFREARNEGAPGGRFVFWRTPQRGCIEVRVTDGRFQTIRPVNNRECDAGNRPTPPDRPLPGGGRPSGPDPVQCLVQSNREDAGNATIERRTELHANQWEFVIRLSSGRYICRTDGRGRLISMNPG